MAVPKKRTSKSKRNMRRSHHKYDVPNLSKCSNCTFPIVSHRICSKCAYYKGVCIK